MAKYTELLKFNKGTREEIYIRERGQCFFCQKQYHMESTSSIGYQIKDIMHFIPKSSLGLGIEENGVLGCRYHHSLLDNGSKGLRNEMLDMMEEYLKRIYEDWDKEKLVYRKWNFEGAV